MIQSAHDLVKELRHCFGKENDEAIASEAVVSPARKYASFAVETVAGQRFTVVVSELRG